MKILLVILSLSSGLSQAGDYLRLHNQQVVYDVDVVVFARQLSQPAAESINNAALVDSAAAKILPDWDQQTPLFRQPETINSDPSDETWQVPLESEQVMVDALAWLNLDRSMDHGVIKRLQSNPIITPLLHNKWRQPATPFLEPEYVRLSSFDLVRPELLPATDEAASPEPEVVTDESLTANNTNALNPYDQYFDPEPSLVSDYSVDGMLAFSKQKFTHLHVKLNYYRVNAAGEQIIYAISQQKRIKLGTWQYFDHQQFGVLAKVTAVKPEAEESP